MEPGRLVEGITLRFEDGPVRAVVPHAFSESRKLALTREVECKRHGVRERAGWVIVHVPSGRRVWLLDRLGDARLLLRLLDRAADWGFGEDEEPARAAALGACRSIFANFPAAIRA
jgi:hypothetical protein